MTAGEVNPSSSMVGSLAKAICFTLAMPILYVISITISYVFNCYTLCDCDV